jgi:hypothetical protein
VGDPVKGREVKQEGGEGGCMRCGRHSKYKGHWVLIYGRGTDKKGLLLDWKNVNKWYMKLYFSMSVSPTERKSEPTKWLVMHN